MKFDAELVASGEGGQPDFHRLVREEGRCPDLCVWAFDLLSLDGRDLRMKPLAARRALLNRVVNGADNQGVQFSPEFADAEKLLAQAEKRKLEGIVCKRKASPYVSGRSADWLKIKTRAWKEAHAVRAKMFNGGRGKSVVRGA